MQLDIIKVNSLILFVISVLYNIRTGYELRRLAVYCGDVDPNAVLLLLDNDNE